MPQAVLAGLVGAGALIGAGLYFAGRRPVEAPPPTGTGSTVAAASAVTAPLTAASDQAVREKATRDATRAVEEQRDKVRKACWADASTDQTNRYVLTFSFDANGQQLSRGMSEDRNNDRRGLAGCLADALAPIRLPAPGIAVSVDVPFELP